MNERRIWQVAVGLGQPDPGGPGSLSSDEIHPVALRLERSLDLVNGGATVQRVSEFGPVADLAEVAVRLKGDDYDVAQVPFECTLTVYATDEEIDLLVHRVATDLAPDAEGFSSVLGRRITIGLRPLFDYAEQADSYGYLVDQHSVDAGSPGS